MARLALNKSSLGRERTRLRSFERFLPSLDLKRRQLMGERAKAVEALQQIERELSDVAGRPVAVTFTPQVMPMVRGILSTLYGRLAAGATQAKVLEAYREAYRGEPFLKVKSLTDTVGTADVRGSNRAIVTIACDERTGTFRAISHIDNLVCPHAGAKTSFAPTRPSSATDAPEAGRGRGSPRGRT